MSNNDWVIVESDESYNGSATDCYKIYGNYNGFHVFCLKSKFNKQILNDILNTIIVQRDDVERFKYLSDIFNLEQTLNDLKVSSKHIVLVFNLNVDNKRYELLVNQKNLISSQLYDAIESVAKMDDISQSFVESVYNDMNRILLEQLDNIEKKAATEPIDKFQYLKGEFELIEKTLNEV